MQLVKHKDTGIYLCYIYEADIRKRFIVHKITES